MMNDYTVTGFSAVPPFAQGLVRDLRVRWALEEAGLPYAVELIEFTARKSEWYRRKQPFGMVPAFTSGGAALFESGAIVHLIAERSEALMPAEAPARAETIVWMYAALNTVEPPIQELLNLDLQYGSEEWVKFRRPAVEQTIGDRLAVLADRLEGMDFLLGRFTAADILMATVLRFARHTDLVASYPAVRDYLTRCESRPAFQTALAAQMADYGENAIPA